MKKKINITLISCILLLCVGCTTTYQEASSETEPLFDDFGNGYFTTITKWNDTNFSYSIVYANDTDVKYVVIKSDYKMGITPLYNADGTLQIYDE